jgi:hypothetical protein
MWLFTTIGFFSVVEKPVDGEHGVTPMLAVRSRVPGDLEALREKYMPELSATIATPRADYKFRAAISHTDFARGLARLAEDIHYDNFKSAVGKTQGYQREHVYHGVWSAAMQLEHLKERR